MAYFAKLNNNNIIERVESVVNEVLKDLNGVEQEQLGIDFLNQLYNTKDNWKQTSYNTQAGVHSSDKSPLRKNFAGIGMIYDEDKDAFISQKPYQSWVLNEDICLWETPVAYPTDGQRYTWNEETQSWTLQTI